MKKILLLCIPAMMFATSCKDLDDYDNLNPKAATTVPAVSLVSNAQRVLANTINTPDYNINPFRFYVQHWAATTYPDESQFVIETRSINRFFWDPLYRDVLSDLNEGKKLVTADAVLDPKVKANQLAAIEVLEVYAWSVLVNTFGDIPYTEALNADNVLPKFDDDAAIFADLTTRLDKAIGMFDASASGLGTGDLYYNGNVANWLKFANSLKLRLGMTLADVDAAKAKTMVEAAAPNVITSNAENAKITYLSALPNRNQLYESLVQSGRSDFVGASTLIDPMLATNDPRLPIYFKPVAGSSNFKGGTAGTPNSATNNSTPGAALENPTLPGMLLTYSEVEFLLAEAVERGFAVAGTAEAHYNAAVTASITEWGGSAADAATYLEKSAVAYNTAAGDWKQKIGTQKWIALYSQPTQAWTEWRRLDAPNLVKPAAAISEIPLRLPYPTTEANLNTTNYAAAASAMGGDVVTSRIFWDKL
ncbi:SusD/RagB family nutrient-binding outer membrane lipoprotein [Adhaeribacter swui]|uniref:SusD/RagB family nutrient-binding outer membrane lipoprotein n=1 Tax=Adhaeribacter swui TaxID=2086471 RepID=A0A7G7G951_9BACT|nr:SusD/RagB family nutrient-binding outer membrane lipoprotein [Adhaeribacter swui]QNF33685.1 SusD/RagB family nutrient-binding outer membrane lipoprotein [Adhaeribacter swui]